MILRRSKSNVRALVKVRRVSSQQESRLIRVPHRSIAPTRAAKSATRTLAVWPVARKAAFVPELPVFEPEPVALAFAWKAAKLLGPVSMALTEKTMPAAQ